MTNQAAFLDSKQCHPLSVRDSEIPQPGAGEVVIENFAVGFNPLDWKIQKYGIYFEKFPLILGSDAGGRVHSVGKDVFRLKVGDRVSVYISELFNGRTDAGVFQKYVRLTAQSTIFKLPEKYSYSQGATFGLCAATAAQGLYSEKQLNLPLPGNESSQQKTILVYGGSSSVGQFVIQFAKQSGLKVVSTVSAKNQALVKRCGADQVIDRNDPNLGDLLQKAGPFDCAFDCISEGNAAKIVSEAMQPNGGRVTTVLPWEFEAPSNVTTSKGMALSVRTEDKTKDWFRPFMEECLAKGTLQLPPVQEISGGLAAIQKVLDDYAEKGVSGTKLIVTGL